MSDVPAWVDRVSGSTFTYPCSGGRHRITWDKGRLIADDHDIEAEQVLRGLGSRTDPECLRLVRSMAGTWTDGEAWLLCSAGSGEVPQWAGGRLRALSRCLAGTPEGLRALLALSLASSIGPFRWVDDKDAATGPLAGRALHDAALAALHACSPVTIDAAACFATPLGAQRGITSIRTDGFLGAAIAVPPSWECDVAQRGVASVDGHFILDVCPRPACDDLDALAVAWTGGGSPVVRDVVLTRAADGWRLHPSTGDPLPNPLGFWERAAVPPSAAYPSHVSLGLPTAQPLQSAAYDLVLADTPRAKVTLTGIAADPDGFNLTVRTASDELGVSNLLTTSLHADWLRSGVLPPVLFRFGVQFADCRRTTTLDKYIQLPALEAIVEMTRSWGGPGWHTQDVRVSPLPPPGPLGICVEWPAMGIGFTRVTIDSQIVRRLSAERR